MAQQQQIAKSHHRGQQVVEVVGDTAGQLADRLHLLGLGELQLEVLLLGGVDEMQDDPGLGAVDGVETAGRKRGGGVAHGSDADIERRRITGMLEHLRDQPVDRVAVGVIDDVAERLPRSGRVGVADQAAERRAALDDLAVGRGPGRG